MPQTIDLKRAVQFIESKGAPADKARLRTILHGAEPDAVILRPLFDLQNNDGGFPSRPRPGNVSSVDATLTTLWRLDGWGLFPSPAAEKALAFLITQQREDGSWDENPALPRIDLAPWIIPGDYNTRVYLTAYSAFWLGLTPHRKQPAFQQAAGYLAVQQEGSGKLPGFSHSSWIGAGVFFLGGEPFRRNAENGLAYLSAIPFSEWEDSQLAWAVDCLRRAGLPVETPWISTALEQLSQRQNEEGSWVSEDGPSYTIAATLEVIRVFHAYQLAQ